MSKIIVTAPNGMRLKVRVQELEKVTQAEVRNSAGEVVHPGREAQSFVDKGVDTFASEARAYDVDATHRLIVEENPA